MSLFTSPTHLKTLTHQAPEEAQAPEDVHQAPEEAQVPEDVHQAPEEA